MMFRYESDEEREDREHANAIRQRAVRVARWQMANEDDPMRRKTYLELIEQWENPTPSEDDDADA